MKKLFLAPFLLIFLSAFFVKAALAEKGEKIRICTQNLFNYGLEDPKTREREQGRRKRKPKKRREQRKHLVERMINARCDLIAVQEVVGERRKIAAALLKSLTQSLSSKSQRKFSSYVSDSNDKRIRNGFIVAEGVFEVLGTESFHRYTLRPLQKYSAPKRYTRGPFAIHLRTKTSTKEIFVLNTHFKSRRSGWKDASKTDFGVLRMEMAAGLREIATKKESELPKEAIVLVLGDRNSDAGSGSSKVLSGELFLDDFRESGGCSINKDEKVICNPRRRRTREFVSLFEKRKKSNPRVYSGGSYRYRRKDLLIDEILIHKDDLSLVERKNGKLNIGIEGKFYRGSDHKLLWAELSL